MFLRSINRTATKNEIRDELLWLAHDNDQTLSEARADKLANKFKKGQFDPELAKFIQYSDLTGERAVNNVLKEQVAA